MKVVQINTFSEIGSTGKICKAISDILSKNNIDNYIIYNLGVKKISDKKIKIANRFYIKIQALMSRVLGNFGFNSLIATKQLIKKLDIIKPDIIHLHNIHSHNVHYSLLFEYIKKRKIKVFWTFHDCWAFTGYCTHFTVEKCDLWKTQCRNCCQYKKYSWFIDKSSSNYLRKKKAIEKVDLTIITPSHWLGEMASQSFFKNSKIHVINNGIDLNIFQPRKSEFREKYNLQNKKIILGVAFNWGYKKGLDVFIKLSEVLDESYKIVLVGTNDKVDKMLPKNILSIHRTNNQIELAEIYSSSFVLFNPTREDTFPTVNIEALACGLPVITSNVGGSPEIIDEKTGVVVDIDDINFILNGIDKIKTTNISSQSCIERSKKYDKDSCFKKYLDLYQGKN